MTAFRPRKRFSCSEEIHPEAILRWSGTTERNGVVTVNVTNLQREIQATDLRIGKNLASDGTPHTCARRLCFTSRLFICEQNSTTMMPPPSRFPPTPRNHIMHSDTFSRRWLLFVAIFLVARLGPVGMTPPAGKRCSTERT